MNKFISTSHILYKYPDAFKKQFFINILTNPFEFEFGLVVLTCDQMCFS